MNANEVNIREREGSNEACYIMPGLLAHTRTEGARASTHVRCN